MSVETSAIEIQRLTGVARRELADAEIAGLDAERIHGADHHRLTFVRLAELGGGRWANAADYFQHCRARRNRSMYDAAGSVSAAEARELCLQAKRLLEEVHDWLRAERPELLR